MLKAVVVEDEVYGMEAILGLLRHYCPDVQIVGIANNALSAIKEIRTKRPDLVFLDVEMPHGNGFHVLEGVADLDFEVVFVTAYDKYAIQALRFSALDYILKPIDYNELQAAVLRAGEKRKLGRNRNKEVLVENMKVAAENRRVSLPTQEGFDFVELNQIVRAEGGGNYTTFFLRGGDRTMVSKTLKEFEEILEPDGFFRIHQSHLINLRHVNRYIRGRGGYVLMSDGAELEVARRKKDEFMEALGKLGNI